MARVLHASTVRHELWGGGGRYIRIVVHDTTAELRAAAGRYRDDTLGWTDTGACFHPAPRRERLVDGEWVASTPRGWAGVMRLAREYLDAEVIIHECVHASLTIYRLDVVQDVRLGDGSSSIRREESLAYIVGDLTTEVLGALNRAGVYPPA